MVFSGDWVGPRGHTSFVRYLQSVSEIQRIQERFENLDFRSLGPQRGFRLNRQEEEEQVAALLQWGQRQDRRNWSLCCLEIQRGSHETAARTRWKNSTRPRTWARSGVVPGSKKRLLPAPVASVKSHWAARRSNQARPPNGPRSRSRRVFHRVRAAVSCDPRWISKQTQRPIPAILSLPHASNAATCSSSS